MNAITCSKVPKIFTNHLFWWREMGGLDGVKMTYSSIIITFSDPGQIKLVLKKRKGFVKMALRFNQKLFIKMVDVYIKLADPFFRKYRIEVLASIVTFKFIFIKSWCSKLFKLFLETIFDILLMYNFSGSGSVSAYSYPNHNLRIYIFYQLKEKLKVKN